MSLKKHLDAKLRFWKGPQFPPGLLSMMCVLDDLGFNRPYLDRVGAMVAGFSRTDFATTSDGYFWYCAMFFACGGGRVAILIPAYQDWNKRDGTQSDRSYAVYTQGNVSNSVMYALMFQIQDALKQAQIEATAYEMVPGTRVMLGFRLLPPAKSSQDAKVLEAMELMFDTVPGLPGVVATDAFNASRFIEAFGPVLGSLEILEQPNQL